MKTNQKENELLTELEEKYCCAIVARLSSVKTHLEQIQLEDHSNPIYLFETLSSLRKIQGNLSNDVSFAATLLAKEYLAERFGVSFCAAEKAQGAPGIDIDITTPDGQRIIAEIKTTVPYKGTDFGAQQIASFKRDFVKLSSAKADFKFLFVTDESTFSVLQKSRYLPFLQGITVVNLVNGDEKCYS